RARLNRADEAPQLNWGKYMGTAEAPDGRHSRRLQIAAQIDLTTTPALAKTGAAPADRFRSPYRALPRPHWRAWPRDCAAKARRPRRRPRPGAARPRSAASGTATHPDRSTARGSG